MDTKQPVSREALYEEVWTDPVTKVAQRYGMSDVGLAKLCRSLAIPLPERGHWAKVKAGKKVARIPLREAVDDSSVAYLSKVDVERLGERESAKRQAAAVREQIRQRLSAERHADVELHPLAKAADRRLRRKDGWTSEKGLRSAPEDVLHIEVTPTSLDRAVALFSSLMSELERQNVSVRIDREGRSTYADVLDTPVKLMITERVRRTDHEITPAEKKAQENYYSRSRLNLDAPFPHIPRYDFHPTGVLTLTTGRWPTRAWHDTARTPLEQRLAEVVPGIVSLAEDIRTRENEENRKKEVQRLAEEDYAFRKQRLDDERNKFKQLETAATDFARAARLRAYIDAVEAKARSIGEQSLELQDWLAWAWAKADWVDPLIVVSDPILDAPEPKKPGIRW